MPDALLLLVVGLPFAGAIAAGLLPTYARNAAAWLAGAVALVDLALVWAAYPTVAAGGVVRHEVEWMPSLGLDFVLRMDGFAWLFAMLVTGIGVLVVLYARYYMSPDDPVPRFFSFLLAFMGVDARRRAVGQPDPAGVLLGADQPLLLPADRLLAPQRRTRATARAWR